ncbi:MAG: CDP-alcohol phosphatidyltransferase family protein [Acidobacteria bacterium]|nr:CDP-alcohol phosphatidyltransferase family protein [Acidobacteriota bacterium]
MGQFLNLANQLTLFRLFLIPLILIAMLYGRHGLALALFLAAAVTDGIDGLVARRMNLKTQLGAYLDPIADKLLLSSSFFILALIHSIPWWVTILVLSRDVIILATSLVLTLATQIRDFPPSILGKMNTAFQVSAVLGVVLRNAYPYPLTVQLAGVAVKLAAASTVLSGVHYAVVTSQKLARHTGPSPSGPTPGRD